MNMKLLVAGAALATLLAVPAFADTINFSQFGSDGTTMADPASGVTTGGVGFTVTGPGAGFEVLTDPGSWYGEFPNGTPVLYDDGAAGAVTITFATPITSLNSIALQDNLFGPYTTTLTAYDGATVVGISSFSAVNPTQPEPSFSVSGLITSVTITSTDDSEGWALGGSGGAPYAGVPEPATWAMMLVGFGGIGGAMRMARGKQASAVA